MRINWDINLIFTLIQKITPIFEGFNNSQKLLIMCFTLHFSNNYLFRLEDW